MKTVNWRPSKPHQQLRAEKDAALATEQAL
jgi:hypothetical protein